MLKTVRMTSDWVVNIYICIYIYCHVQVHRLIVVDDARRVEGVVSLSDVVHFLVSPTNTLTLVLRPVYSDTTQLNSTDPVEQRTAKSVVFLFMTSWPTNWVNWVTTFIDRWQLFTLWTCRQLDVELSWVAINGPLVMLRSSLLVSATLT